MHVRCIGPRLKLAARNSTRSCLAINVDAVIKKLNLGASKRETRAKLVRGCARTRWRGHEFVTRCLSNFMQIRRGVRERVRPRRAEQHAPFRTFVNIHEHALSLLFRFLFSCHAFPVSVFPSRNRGSVSASTVRLTNAPLEKCLSRSCEISRGNRLPRPVPLPKQMLTDIKILPRL